MVGREPVWILFLNPMQGRAENMEAVARASSREALVRLLESERVEPYTESTDMPAQSPNTHDTPWAMQCNPTTWHKSFRKGGPLEWYNPPMEGVDEPFRQVPRVLDRSDEIDVLFEAT
jgi:hypothetical protein